MDEKIYQKISQLIDTRQQGVLATMVSSTPGTPRKIGTKMLVMADGTIVGTIGGGKFEKDIIDKALEVINSGEPVMINEDLSTSPGGMGAVCGGQVSIFLEPVLKRVPLYIFGAGHVGKAIAEMAQYMEFFINVVDDRPQWANSENYPMDCRLWTGNMLESAENIPLEDNALVIILTRSWKMDEGILRRLIRRPYGYLGVIGSKNKLQTHYDNLIKEGFTREDFSRVYSPIGIPIGAYSPHEIAVSILAEIIAIEKGVRHQLPGWQGALSLRGDS